MISYKIFINSKTIYAIEIKRIDSLTSISKLNNYEYRVYNEVGLKSKPVTEKDRYLCGTVRHRYKDGVFVLMNKVNKLIIKKEKSDPKHEKKMIDNFNTIKYKNNLLYYVMKIYEQEKAHTEPSSSG